jgi:hypothetical protein
MMHAATDTFQSVQLHHNGKKILLSSKQLKNDKAIAHTINTCEGHNAALLSHKNLFIHAGHLLG